MSKITESARGQECQVRIPGACNRNPETTVLAHLNGGGMGSKMPDYQGAYCCSSCHDVIDGRVLYCGEDSIRLAHYEGVFRTQEMLVAQGLIEVKSK